MHDLTAAELRAELHRMVREGRFPSRAELNAFLGAQGLSQTRNGTDYVSVITGTKERVRVYLPPSLHLSRLDPSAQIIKDGGNTFVIGRVPRRALDVFSVYVIAGVSPNDEFAAYVGSTAGLPHRLAEHFHGRDGTSVDLARWARIKQAQLYASEMMCTNDRGGAIQLEGSLTKELERLGWYLPGVSRWGAASKTAAMMSKSFRFSRVSWSEPRLADIKRWTPLKSFKFFG